MSRRLRVEVLRVSRPRESEIDLRLLFHHRPKANKPSENVQFSNAKVRRVHAMKA
jgi:hypothetical protein